MTKLNSLRVLTDGNVFEKEFPKDDGTRIKRCVCISHPSTSLGFSGFRDIPHIVFTKINNNNYTISLYTGFVIDKNKPIELLTGRNKFFLQVYRDFFAHTYNSTDDVNIVNSAMKNRQTLITRITSNAGDVANDHYDFKGLDKAIQYMNNTCS